MEKTIHPSQVSGEVRPPCSKSYAQRALAAALLSDGETTLSNIELCDDTRYAMNVITGLGASVRQTGPTEYVIRGGLAPIPTPSIRANRGSPRGSSPPSQPSATGA